LPLATWAGGLVIRVLGSTWRYQVSEPPGYRASKGAGNHHVYAFWHSGILPLAYLRRDGDIAVLVSRHRDGELITRIIEGLGYVAARGSSTRGGEAGVRAMLQWAALDHDLAITPDGPRGPKEQAKEGIVYLAARTGRAIIPIGMGISRAWILRSWDGFRIPQPFARVHVIYGEPLYVAEASAAEMESARVAFEQSLNTVTRVARESAGARS
jgi:lysophospholipid acyltransferase (LPLAT)-like uncharacterized protein